MFLLYSLSLGGPIWPIVDLWFGAPGFARSEPIVVTQLSSIIQVTTKSSKTFDRVAVRAIGRISSSHVIDWAFGIGTMLASFQGTGNSECNKDLLKILATGSANS